MAAESSLFQRRCRLAFPYVTWGLRRITNSRDPEKMHISELNRGVKVADLEEFLFSGIDA
jgi:hypothetical protein